MFNEHLSRREWMKLAAVGGLAVPTSGWLSTLAARAAGRPAAEQTKHKHCILLFMTGGASHVDTFDPKPDDKSSAFKPIATNVSGIQVCETLPRVAKVMDLQNGNVIFEKPLFGQPLPQLRARGESRL